MVMYGTQMPRFRAMTPWEASDCRSVVTLADHATQCLCANRPRIAEPELDRLSAGKDARPTNP